jgi:hypothetical protein
MVNEKLCERVGLHEVAYFVQNSHHATHVDHEYLSINQWLISPVERKTPTACCRRIALFDLPGLILGLITASTAFRFVNHQVSTAGEFCGLLSPSRAVFCCLKLGAAR